MSDRIIRRQFAVPLILGLGIGLTVPPFVPPAGAQAGVGASGTIGRGTEPGDRQYNRPAPVAAAPVLIYVPAPETVLPSPAPAAVAAADRSEHAEPRPKEVALNMPALARQQPVPGLSPRVGPRLLDGPDRRLPPAADRRLRRVGGHVLARPGGAARDGGGMGHSRLVHRPDGVFLGLLPV